MKLRLLARTLDEKVIGLRAYPDLKKDEYALFHYDNDEFSPFWNKGVMYPIDIGFYDKNKKLVYKTNMEKDQRTLVYPPCKYRFVVETHLGELDKFDF